MTKQTTAERLQPYQACCCDFFILIDSWQQQSHCDSDESWLVRGNIFNQTDSWKHESSEKSTDEHAAVKWSLSLWVTWCSITHTNRLLQRQSFSLLLMKVALLIGSLAVITPLDWQCDGMTRPLMKVSFHSTTRTFSQCPATATFHCPTLPTP